MKRKGYDEKKNQIVQAANALFLDKGYESTSVDEILESVKISKGTFYHYFTSKNEVLRSIVDNFTESFVLRLNPIADDKKMSALQKLNAYFELNQSMKKANQALITQVIAIWYKEENLIYKERLNKSLLTALTPHLVKILKQGSLEGVFDIINPDETAVLIIQLGFCLRDRLVEEFFIKEPDIKNLVEIVKTHQRGMEKILGISEDSLTFFSPRFFK